MKYNILITFLILSAITFTALLFKDVEQRSTANQAAEQVNDWIEAKHVERVLTPKTYTDANGNEWTFQTHWKGYNVTVTCLINGNESTVCDKRLRAWSTAQVEADADTFRKNIITMLQEQNS